MHGVKRARLSAEAKAQRKVKEQSKLQAYLQLETHFFELKDADVCSEDSLEVTGKLLSFNPEHYTAWNFRRRILDRLFAHDSRSASLNQAAKKDFFAAAPALRSHPKVYWIWNHRQWCLEEYPDAPVTAEEDDTGAETSKEATAAARLAAVEQKWRLEMRLVDKMLDLDGRNFHGWNYRRYLLTQLARASAETGSTDGSSSASSELSYTLSKIEKDFSNFSAWHQRQLLYSRQWQLQAATRSDSGSSALTKANDLAREFELVQQAMYTDPSDQSVWLYHRWLVEEDPRAEVLDREIKAVEELLEIEPDSKWSMQSIVHYRSLRRTLHSKIDEQQDLAEERRLLQALVIIDPDRRRRYEDELCKRI
ncbi:protein prenylyltransferase [Tilletiaria anomala UBC 951]|uniref:Geranylgeranyl transferase type-2 subunit alpha n=1 Tax=Tilletiaria anomala (strain ATCC 24038 / CBS 436.72 / UBC 951) TaxID=1037660 RepID=A0A066WHB2_TILAU|nr:protein prenylyltransferase [Tilletiaria anomala UBC 951]KDN53216.1 protein prenylyltransferase [Tilletiaria anomala UBC 951]